MILKAAAPLTRRAREGPTARDGPAFSYEQSPYVHRRFIAVCFDGAYRNQANTPVLVTGGHHRGLWMSHFVCRVREGLEEGTRRAYREACAGSPAYGGSRYCVLHHPCREKNGAFEEALARKLRTKDYDFRGVVFPDGTADFADVTFDDEADFSDAIFYGMANFRRATFTKDVAFYATIFRGEGRFRRTTFGGSVDFEAPPEGYSFNARANFSMAVFETRARFIGRRLFDARVGEDAAAKAKQAQERPVTFRDALIKHPESFSLDRVRLRPSWFIDTNVKDLRFTNVQWSGLSGGLEGSIGDELAAVRERRKKDPEAGGPHEVLAKACRELSANAEENRDYPTANEFYYWSMEALRKKKDRRNFGLIATLYWALSGYGVRPIRALCVLLALGGVFAVLYTLTGPPEFRPSSPANLWQDLGNFGQALVYSFGTLARLGPEPHPNEPGLFQLLVIAAGLLGPLQIGLLLLSVRRRVMR